MKKKTKSFSVSKAMLYESYLKVCSKNGCAGIDKQTIDMFNENLGSNLYKVWNRMASGSYYPPAVRTVPIAKKQGGTRPLGIPTVGDRTSTGSGERLSGTNLEPLFHVSSFGYRPGRSAHDALVQCQHNCIEYSWVVDLDIKGFFDNLNHDWMIKMVAHHTQEKWVLLYTERWLKAGIEQTDGSIATRVKGTPQGGVISPLLANLYLHHAFDMWMGRHFALNAFERYADDIIVHCNSKTEAEQMLEAIRERLQGFGLELHPEKTKLVYCKNDLRKEEHEHNSFTFLSYSFQPRGKLISFGKPNKIMEFSAAICCKAKAFIRQKIRGVFNPRNTQVSLESAAIKLNPKIRGWLNYYCRFNAKIAGRVFLYLNELIRRWMMEKFRVKSQKAVLQRYKEYVQSNRSLLVHWQKGITF